MADVHRDFFVGALECDLNEADGDMLGFNVCPEWRDENVSMLEEGWFSASFELLACDWANGACGGNKGDAGAGPTLIASKLASWPVKDVVEL